MSADVKCFRCGHAREQHDPNTVANADGGTRCLFLNSDYDQCSCYAFAADENEAHKQTLARRKRVRKAS